MHEQLQGEIKYFIKSPSVEAPRPVETEHSEDLNDEDSDDEKFDEQVHRESRTPTWRERFRDVKNLYFPRRQKAVSEYQLEIRRIGYFQRMRQLFVRPHVRATTAATCVMAAQQLCGINILAFLSSTVFSDAVSPHFPASPVSLQNPDEDAARMAAQKKALWMSFGFGIANFLFTWLAWGTIDRKGRRWLLNLSFPNMAWSLIALGCCFQISEDKPDLRLGWIVFFSITFTIGEFFQSIPLLDMPHRTNNPSAYSPGVGPVPFTASAEMFPLYIREVGMSFAVFVNLLGAGMIALLVPTLAHALTHTGLLCLFAGLNLIAWALCYFFYPETARISLEELRAVFEVPLGMQARYRWTYIKFLWSWYVLRRLEDEPEPIHLWYKNVCKEREEAEKRRQEQSEAGSQIAELEDNSLMHGANTDPESVRLRGELDRALRENADLRRMMESMRGPQEVTDHNGIGQGASSSTFVPGRHED